MKILVTGNAGFIGFQVVKKLIARGDRVVGIDSLNDYYDVGIKRKRLEMQKEIASTSQGEFTFVEDNIADLEAVNNCFKEHSFDRVINLAAQAGVRYSLENPHSYVESNIIGFTNIIEACRHFEVEHLTYASTSSVYGANSAMPFSEHDGVNHPLQFYAATKRANELIAHSYSHLFQLPTTGLRFFTVYGPWGRPDMALFLFTKNILAGEPINVFNHGDHVRDFTYVDDIAEGVLRINDLAATPNEDWDSENPDPATSNAPFRIYNIGNNTPIKLSTYIEAIEEVVGKKAIKNLLPLQMGDVPTTYADVSELRNVVNYKPSTDIKDGVRAFVEWYREYYSV